MPSTSREAGSGPRRALIVAAHTVDADLACGGTVRRLTRDGWDVRYLIVTDGSADCINPSMSAAQSACWRRRAQQQAARLLDAGVRFLDVSLSPFADPQELRAPIVRELREFRPQAVYTHDPVPVVLDEHRVNHVAHRLTGLATADAVYPLARNRHSFPLHLEAGLRTHRVSALYLWDTPAPDVQRDVEHELHAKMAALRFHGLLVDDGQCHGVPSVALATERFKRLLLAP